MPAIRNAPGHTLQLERTPVISTSAYSANDQVGNLLKFPFDLPGNGGKLAEVAIYDKADVGALFNIFVFNGPVTVSADNAAGALSDTDMRKLVWQKTMAGGYLNLPSNQVALVDAGLRRFVGRTLYVSLWAVATPTFATTSSLMVKLTVVQ
jgi:hypothetical protein